MKCYVREGISGPKVLGNLVERLVEVFFIDNNQSHHVVNKVIYNLLFPFIAPKTLSIHPIKEGRELIIFLG